MAELADELEGLLSHLAGEGRLDSSGHFTVDFFKGSEKLREYQLADPSQYVLKLVQAAVASRAESIQVRIDRRCLQLSHEGQALQAEELQSLSECLLYRERYAQRPHLVHLATALNTALRWGVESLIVESWLDGQGVALVVTPTTQKAGRVVGDQVRPNGTRILMRRHADTLVPPEERWLRGRAGLCPIPICLNGRANLKPDFGRPPLPNFLKPLRPIMNLMRRWSPWGHVATREQERAVPWWVQIWNVDDYVFGECHRHHHLLEKRLTCTPCYQSFVLPKACEASLREEEACDTQPHPDDQVSARAGMVHCRQALALELDLAPETRLLFVQDGVLLGEKQVTLDKIRGGVALLTCAGLKTDLSQFNLVEDQAYHDLVKAVESQLMELSLDLAHRLNADSTQVPLGSYVRGYLPIPRGSLHRPRFR